jgi:hypothetical protein
LVQLLTDSAWPMDAHDSGNQLNLL